MCVWCVPVVYVYCVCVVLSPCVQAYGRDLSEANEWCRKYKETNNLKDLTQAWELYYHVFRRISKQLPQVRGHREQFISENCSLWPLCCVHTYAHIYLKRWLTSRQVA